MPGGLQGWVNVWTKVNNKHTVFLDGRSEDTKKTETNDDKSGQQRGGADTASTAASSTWDDPEARAIRRFNSRKNRRRLQRTKSHSDLVREMAVTQDKKIEAGKDASSKLEPDEATDVASPVSESSSKHQKPEAPPQHKNSEEDSSSLRWAVGLFDLPGDAKIPIPSKDQVAAKNPVTTGKYLNETAFVQQYQQSRPHTDMNRSRSGETASRQGSLGSTDSEKARRPPAAVRARSSGGDEVHVSQQGPAPRSGKPTHRHHSSAASAAACSSCEDLVAKLYAVQADLEYLRSVSLRGEYLCASCENQSSKRTKKKYGRVASNKPSALSEASQRLHDVSGRHKRQIESMTRERSRWQQDIHSKLSKSAMMCNHWSKEAAIRGEEETNLESELITAQAERNALSREVQTLRAHVEEQKKEVAQHQALHETLVQYEERGLDAAQDAVQRRDEIISELSLRLERTLDTLEMERQQQRQRRQIIFPGRDSARSVPFDAMKMNEELEKAKDDARSAQKELNSVKAEAAEREKQLQLKCELLERRLKEKEESEPA